MNAKSRKHFRHTSPMDYLPSDERTKAHSGTCGWATSRDLDRVMAKSNEVSSAYLEKLDKDRDRRSEVRYKSLQNIPMSIRQMINPNDTPESVPVRRWVALPRSTPRQVKKTHSSHQDNRRGASQAPPRSEHPEYHPRSSEGTPRVGYHPDSLINSLRDSIDSDELFGVTSVPFKCPALSSSRKKNCCIPSRLDSQIALRKAMRSQIEQQRNSALTNHVNFVNSNKLSGTQLNPPIGLLRPKLSYDSHLTARQMTEGNIELLAILSVQEHNVPIFADHEVSKYNTFD